MSGRSSKILRRYLIAQGAMGKGVLHYFFTGRFNRQTGEKIFYPRFLSNEKSAKDTYKEASWLEKTTLLRGMVYYLFNKANAQEAKQ